MASERVVIVVSRYNASVTDALVEGAQRAHARRRSGEPAPEVVDAPGSYELPQIAAAALATGRFVGAVALGCIIRGETDHDRYIAAAVADGLMRVALDSGRPVALGVLTTETAAQALARAGGAQGNKGEEAMDALLDSLESIARVRGEASAAAMASRPDKARRATGGRA